MVDSVESDSIGGTESALMRGVLCSTFRINRTGRHKVVVILSKCINGIFSVGNGCNIKHTDTVFGKIGHIELGRGTVDIGTCGSDQY